MESEKIIDIFIKTYHKDFVWLYYCIKSIHKFAKNFRKVIIVSDNDGNEVPKIITDIMPLDVFYTDLPSTLPTNLKMSIGYVWQQVVKLQWMEYSDSDAVLLLDSDWMISGDLSAKDLVDEDGKFHWFYRDWNLAEDAICWKIPTTIFLQREPRYEAMCLPGYIFEKNTTKRFIDYVMKIHDKTTLWDIFTVPNIQSFSEYNAYGNFIDSVDEGNNVYHKKVNITNYTPFYNSNIVVSWSWGGLKDEDRKRREEILKLSEEEKNQIDQINQIFALPIPTKEIVNEGSNVEIIDEANFQLRNKNNRTPKMNMILGNN